MTEYIKENVEDLRESFDEIGNPKLQILALLLAMITKIFWEKEKMVKL